MAGKVWGQGKAEPEAPALEPIEYINPVQGHTTFRKAEHVHEWTEYPSGKRKCKPCGAVERPERDE